MFRWLPWKFFVKHASRRYGFVDPATLLARLRRFAQPSEVAEPLELLRAGIIFHARGLVNARAIQQNLDWVWPYWVERQFNPDDSSFVPRAFSFSHINLTHRNWTAVGRPGLPLYPVVDPRGLVTPLYDGWSLDFWIITDSGGRLLPSKLDDEAVTQRLELDPELQVVTRCSRDGLVLDLATSVIAVGGAAAAVVTTVGAAADEDGWLVVAVRPYNPEGVQFIHRIESALPEPAIRVNDEATVDFSAPPEAWRMAHYAEGDVHLDLPGNDTRRGIECDVGMATGAALFRVTAGHPLSLKVTVGLERDLKELPTPPAIGLTWPAALQGNAQLQIPDSGMQFLYDAAVRTLLLLSADELVPGPYTYRRFWFRDACLMLHPLIAMGQADRAERILATFARRQTSAGYFLSQEGEWDANGQVLWITARFSAMTGKKPDARLEHALRQAVRWLDKKRLKTNQPAGTHGLLPAGFSAEHLGPNDFYYWDDFWAWGGLSAIAAHWRQEGNITAADEAGALAADFARSVETSINAIPASRARGGIPAAPGRRMDAGAVGSMVADYPLQLFPPGEKRLAATLEFLIERCFHQGGFFQEMIHSGVNAYLTLDLAQSLLRAGDARFAELIRRVAALASPTGQWPEAIHPRTLGGCMGDGQHGWAAGEWIMMMRNCFIREEGSSLIIGSGLLPEWLASPDELRFGPTLTAWGPVSVRLQASVLRLEASWRHIAPALVIAVPGFKRIEASPGEMEFHLQRP